MLFSEHILGSIACIFMMRDILINGISIILSSLSFIVKKYLRILGISDIYHKVVTMSSEPMPRI